jgi:hypothetical protein
MRIALIAIVAACLVAAAPVFGRSSAAADGRTAGVPPPATCTLALSTTQVLPISARPQARLT